MPHPHRFDITVVRPSGEGHTFDVNSHNCFRSFIERVRNEMGVPNGQFIKLLWDDVVLDPVTTRPPFMPDWPETNLPWWDRRVPRVERVELRHYGICGPCTLTLVGS